LDQGWIKVGSRLDQGWIKVECVSHQAIKAITLAKIFLSFLHGWTMLSGWGIYFAVMIQEIVLH